MAGSLLTGRAFSLFGDTQPALKQSDMVGMVSRLLVLFTLLAATTAHAGDNGIALEVYTGQRSPDATRLVSPVLDELAKSKIDSGDTVGRRIANLSTPSQTVSGISATFAQEADDGLRLYAQGNFNDAIHKLVPLIDSAQHNSGAFAKDPKLTQPLQKAMIALALAYSRNGDQGAMRSQFDEMIRSFPGVQVARTVYGPQAAQAFDDSSKLLAAQGTGKLIVHVTAGVVFVDETYRSSGDLTLEVPPGEYRVLVIANGLPSRTHNVTITANSEKTVTIDAAYDQAIQTGAGWTGLLFPNAAAREAHEAEYAARLAHEIKANSVALVGLDQSKSGGVVVGSLISLERATEIRRANVALDPDPSRDRLKALAHYIVGEGDTGGIDVVDLSKQPVHTPEPTGDHQPKAVAQSDTVETRWGGYRWLALGAAVGLAGTSATMYLLNGHCHGPPPPNGSPCNNVYDSSPWDRDTALAAIPFAAVAIYLFATQTKTVDAHTAALVPVDHGAVATYAFTW